MDGTCRWLETRSRWSKLRELGQQEKLALAGLTSDAARGFIEALPSITDLMPRLTYAEVAGEADPPIAEQMLSSNALRQARHRERQRALRNASER
jgi:hypothetical protein